MKVFVETEKYFRYFVLISIWILDSAAIATVSSGIRDELHGLFSEFFSGDGLAADYLLCHLISRV